MDKNLSTSTNTTPTLMTVTQVAATGLISAYLLRGLIRQGKVPCVKVGRTYLINYELFCKGLNDPNWVGYKMVG